MKIQANKLIDEFIEKNDRRWRSQVFENKEDQIIIVATNPSLADWTNPTVETTLSFAGICKNCAMVACPPGQFFG